MKIAVPTKDNFVDDHFGHCAYYTIFTIEEGKVVSSETLPSPQGCGCKSNIASILKDKGVTLMLAGNMGDGAKNKLAECNIEVIRGCSGHISALIALFLSGSLKDSGSECHHECH